jgi:hypothetical protein
MFEKVSLFLVLCQQLPEDDRDILQVTALWSPKHPQPPTPAEAPPYDPTDPRQNPLNPQGLKP